MRRLSALLLLATSAALGGTADAGRGSPPARRAMQPAPRQLMHWVHQKASALREHGAAAMPERRETKAEKRAQRAALRAMKAAARKQRRAERFGLFDAHAAEMPRSFAPAAPRKGSAEIAALRRQLIAEGHDEVAELPDGTIVGKHEGNQSLTFIRPGADGQVVRRKVTFASRPMPANAEASTPSLEKTSTSAELAAGPSATRPAADRRGARSPRPNGITIGGKPMAAGPIRNNGIDRDVPAGEWFDVAKLAGVRHDVIAPGSQIIQGSRIMSPDGPLHIRAAD